MLHAEIYSEKNKLWQHSCCTVIKRLSTDLFRLSLYIYLYPFWCYVTLFKATRVHGQNLSFWVPEHGAAAASAISLFVVLCVSYEILQNASDNRAACKFANVFAGIKLFSPRGDDGANWTWGRQSRPFRGGSKCECECKCLGLFCLNAGSLSRMCSPTLTQCCCSSQHAPLYKRCPINPLTPFDGPGSGYKRSSKRKPCHKYQPCECHYGNLQPVLWHRGRWVDLG